MSSHVSVLLHESIEALAIKPNGIYIDCTFGRGGHTREIMTHLGEGGRMYAIDKDPAAIEYAKTEMQDARFTIWHGSFSELQAMCEEKGLVGQVDGILMDLGVSSPQLDEAERGFSFMKEGPLDMRMDTSKGLTARQWLQQNDEAEIARVLKEYGEERFAKKIAAWIKEALAEDGLHSTIELAKLVERAVRNKEKNKHPATRTFQGLRIAVNKELSDIECALESAVNVLAPEGRLAVISFHSLEDRLVKRFLRTQSKPKPLPKGLPIMEKDVVMPMSLVGKAIFPSDEEIQVNPRSRSAVLRIAHKNGESEHV